MELNLFIKELEESLIKRGISPDVADKHVHTLRRTFTEEDLREIQNIQSPNEVEEIAESIALLLKKNKIKASETKAVDVQTPPEPRAPQPKPATAEPTPKRNPELPQEGNRGYQTRRETPRKPVSEPILPPDDYYEDDSKASSKGFYIFWLVFIFTLPITVTLAAAFFGLFIGVFAALSALIVGLIAALIGLVAVGAGVSLVGIIFGITQLFSFAAAGVYEIGLGVMIIGVVMLAGILIYNFAIRFLPWLIRKVWQLLVFTCGKIKVLFLFARRECYKL